jgi:peptide/nickel transport system permease protein
MQSRRVIRRCLSNLGLVVGSLIIFAFVIVALAAPLIAPPEDESPYLLPRDGFKLVPKPPGPDHPLGTMAGQYDIFYGLVWGTRVAFWIGLSITLGRALVGVLLGLTSGYYGGLIDAIIMRMTDAFMAFPVMAAVIVTVALFGGPPRGWMLEPRVTLVTLVEPYIVLTLILFGWMPYARLMRGNVLAEQNKEYIQATTSVGASSRRILFRHLLPNVTRGLFVLAASDIGAMVALVAMLTFLGLARGSWGVQTANWGEMLNLSRDWIIGTATNAFEYWYTYLPPSMAIVFFSIGWNLMGDGLRDVLDPRLRSSR